MKNKEYYMPVLRNYEQAAVVSHLLKDRNQLELLSSKFGIPQQDILLIALNASGIKYGDVKNDRGRFVVTFPNQRSYFVALTITDKPFSPFEHREGLVFFNDEPFASATEVEEDTCTDSYWRRGKKHLTLNSNSRSNCRGCSFCGTYGLKGDDKALTTATAIRRKAEALQTELNDNLSVIESVGVVTGCFPSENGLAEHLLIIRQVLSEYGFTGEIQYIGSQLRSPTKIKELVSSGPLALYLTIEAFQRREQLMKGTKSSLTLESGREVLAKAKDLGVDTSFLYIAGLDTLEEMRRQFPLYKNLVTRLPQVQTFQAYKQEQVLLRLPEAGSVEYFLETRKIAEDSFPDLPPTIGNNYRSLWFTTYANQELPKPII